jgi:hypothetical protein
MFKGPELATFAEVQAGAVLDGRIATTIGLDPSTNSNDVLLNVTAIRRTMRILGIGELVLAGEQGEAGSTVLLGAQVQADGTLSAVGARVNSETLARTGVDDPLHNSRPWASWPQATVTLNRAAAGSRISDEVAPGRKQKTREQAWAGVLDEVLRRGMLEAGSKILSVDADSKFVAYTTPALTVLGACTGDTITTTLGAVLYVGAHFICYRSAKEAGKANQTRWSLLPMGEQLDRRAVGWGYAHLHQYAGARKS